MPALVAFLHVAAEGRRSAMLDRMQYTLSFVIQQMTVLFGELSSVGADYIGHLTRRPVHQDPASLTALNVSRGLTIF
jgi:hypothetical protein